MLKQTKRNGIMILTIICLMAMILQSCSEDVPQKNNGFHEPTIDLSKQVDARCLCEKQVAVQKPIVFVTTKKYTRLLRITPSILQAIATDESGQIISTARFKTKHRSYPSYHIERKILPKMFGPETAKIILDPTGGESIKVVTRTIFTSECWKEDATAEMFKYTRTTIEHSIHIKSRSKIEF